MTERRKPTRAQLTAKRKLAARDKHRNVESVSIPLSDEAISLLRKQEELFKAKFGRDPDDTDPIFFDPDADTPQAISEASLVAAGRAALPGKTIETLDDLDEVLGGMSVAHGLAFEDVRRNLEIVDRLIADTDADNADWSSAYWLLADMTNRIVEQTDLPARRYVPKAPPVHDIDDAAVHDTPEGVAYVREMVPLMRRDFAEYWSQYMRRKSAAG